MSKKGAEAAKESVNSARQIVTEAYLKSKTTLDLEDEVSSLDASLSSPSFMYRNMLTFSFPSHLNKKFSKSKATYCVCYAS